MFPADEQGQGRPPVAREFLRRQLKALFGLEDTSGVELAGLVHAVTHLYDYAVSQGAEGPELSGPRWALLLVLMAHERFGKEHWMTPTTLSRFQGVSKNTISSLLRGLEEQGYIERTLDAEDLRVFHIRLTEAGREVAQRLAPQRVAYLDRLASDLSGEEREQLVSLLEKLHRSVLKNSNLDKTPFCRPEQTTP